MCKKNVGLFAYNSCIFKYLYVIRCLITAEPEKFIKWDREKHIITALRAGAHFVAGTFSQVSVMKE
jgi:hypothetical protein